MWEAERTLSKPARWSYVAAVGFLLGLTILTKGLIGVAIVGVTYGCHTLLTRRLSLAICLRALAVLLLAAIVASFWYIPVEIKHSGFLHYYFIDRHVLGFATSTQIHGEAPWWYYLPIILGGGLPWIGYVPISIADEMARRVKNKDVANKAEPSTCDATALLLCWLIGSTVLLSVSNSKLVTYIWPVFPAVAILSALGWARLLDGRLLQNAARLFAPLFHFFIAKRSDRVAAGGLRRS